MSNNPGQQQQQGAPPPPPPPSASTGGQPHGGGGGGGILPAVNFATIPGWEKLTPQQQQLQTFQYHHMQYTQLLARNQLTPEILAANPQIHQIHQMMMHSGQVAAQAHLMAPRPMLPPLSVVPVGPGLSGRHAPTLLPTSSGAIAVASGQQPAAAAAAVSRKRKSDRYYLPDKLYEILPESPLFVSLQDAERRIDAALDLKMAALHELAASAKRGRYLFLCCFSFSFPLYHYITLSLHVHITKILKITL